MDLIPYLDPKFGQFPEPVVFVYGGQIIYSNEPGEAVVKSDERARDLLCALAEHPGSAVDLTVGDKLWYVTVSPMDGGDLLVLRPLDTPEEREHPFSNAMFRMRECLRSYTNIQTKLRRDLGEHDLLPEFERDLANQKKLLLQMLRLTRQAELTQDLNRNTYPMEEGFDLGLVISEMAEEVTLLADLMGVTFTYSSNVKNLPFKASKSLLTQMLLAVISNGIRAAGRGGTAELKLHVGLDRCVISLRDNGPGISHDRMANLFSGDAPEDTDAYGEGAGLGLYNAQRISRLHGGVLIVESNTDEGACIVVSLPIVTPPSVPARNNPGYDNLGGYSPVLIELSDILPWKAFVPPGAVISDEIEV